MKADASAPSRRARRLGYGGLIPFVGLAAVPWFASPEAGRLAMGALLGYGAVIASFLGAVHWGLAMRDDEPSRAETSLLWGVAPGLLGWTALLVGGGAGLMLMALLLWACLAADGVLYPRPMLQGWLPLRLRLTVVASLSCLAAAALAQR